MSTKQNKSDKKSKKSSEKTADKKSKQKRLIVEKEDEIQSNEHFDKPITSMAGDSVDASNVVENIEELKASNVPIIVKMPKIGENIFDEEPDIVYSSSIDYPRGEYGFHHFIHNNKNKMEKLKQFEGKKKVYLVFNKFERYVDGYDKSIGAVSKEFFSLNDKPDILSRGFYKLWEILLMFNLIDTTKDKFISAHLAESPGSFVQATMFYRDVYCKKGVSKNDKYYSVALHPEDVGGKEHVPELETKFVEYYKKEKPQRFTQHETYTKGQAGGSKTKDNGDITNPKTIKLFGGQMDDKADLITGDGGFEWINENVQEQEAFKLIIAEVVAGAKLQKKGGNFVCKFFETFTKTSIKIIAMLCTLYDDIHFVKPLTSRLSNSEKYAVCTGFKYSDKDKEYKDIVKKLDTLLQTLHKTEKNKINDIFPSFVVPKELIKHIIELNRKISNAQLKSIGEIISFVDKEIYSGDEYHERKAEQIVCSDFWNSTFLPTADELEKKKKTYSHIVRHALAISGKDLKKLEGLLVNVNNQ